ncbi:MAG: NAD(P)H-binding protein, partial [Parvularculaceae bacterium]|nr:NAD(P)H-binding protein [Parvularculaceae bacterium]
MRILLIGAYGFLGAACARALHARGHEVVGLGRDVALGRRLLPEVSWLKADLRDLCASDGWKPLLAGVDAVVNAAGALQDGPRDDLRAVHVDAVRACLDAAACVGVRRFVQISAVGAAPDAATLFLRTKAEGDAAVRASALDWTILKPGLVIGRDAYGGTALLRMLAAFPVAAPLAFPEARVQTVASEDVA